MEWRICKRFPAYEVSEQGDVRRIKAGKFSGVVGKVMKPYPHPAGYVMYQLREGNRAFRPLGHQLVAEAFIGPKPFPTAEVCHEDGTRTNNHWSNLRWDSRKGNHADKVRHGTHNRGERAPHAKLTPAQVREIRSRVAAGTRQRILATEYGVDPMTINSVVRRRSWVDVA
jgi:hypothetical protein